MALSRIGIGGVGRTYGTITAKSEDVGARPGDLFTRINPGGVGKTYGAVTDKSEAIAGRPDTLFTRIGVGGVGAKYSVVAKAPQEAVILTKKTKGNYVGKQYVDELITRDDEEILEILTMMMNSDIL